MILDHVFHVMMGMSSTTKNAITLGSVVAVEMFLTVNCLISWVSAVGVSTDTT